MRKTRWEKEESDDASVETQKPGSRLRHIYIPTPDQVVQCVHPDRGERHNLGLDMASLWLEEKFSMPTRHYATRSRGWGRYGLAGGIPRFKARLGEISPHLNLEVAMRTRVRMRVFPQS